MKKKVGEVDEREEDSVIWPCRMIGMNGVDEFKFKVWDRLLLEFWIFEGGAKSQLYFPHLFTVCISLLLFLCLLFCYRFIFIHNG